MVLFSIVQFRGRVWSSRLLQGMDRVGTGLKQSMTMEVGSGLEQSRGLRPRKQAGVIFELRAR